MSASTVVVTWRQHPTTLKWHAWRSDEEVSVCRYAERGGDEQPAAPTGARQCVLCCDTLADEADRFPPPPAEEDIEVMWATFEGGPFDGERIPLKVVRTSAVTHRVLAAQYTRAEVAARPDPTVSKEAP